MLPSLERLKCAVHRTGDMLRGWARGLVGLPCGAVSCSLSAVSTLASERTLPLPSCEDDGREMNVKRLLDKLGCRHPSFLVSGVLLGMGIILTAPDPSLL